MGYTYIGKLPNLWFCLPGQAKSQMLLTLASSQIKNVACQGKQNHGFLHTLASSQICDFACQASKITDFTYLGRFAVGGGGEGVAPVTLWFGQLAVAHQDTQSVICGLRTTSLSTISTGMRHRRAQARDAPAQPP